MDLLRHLADHAADLARLIPFTPSQEDPIGAVCRMIVRMVWSVGAFSATMVAQRG
jgi:hypothetical protein